MPAENPDGTIRTPIYQEQELNVKKWLTFHKDRT